MGIEWHLIVVFLYVFLMAELNFFLHITWILGFLLHCYHSYLFLFDLQGVLKSVFWIQIICQFYVLQTSFAALWLVFLFPLEYLLLNRFFIVVGPNQYLWLVLFLSYVLSLFLIRGQEVVILYFFFKPCFFFHIEVFCLELTGVWYEVRLKYLY